MDIRNLPIIRAISAATAADEEAASALGLPIVQDGPPTPGQNQDYNIDGTPTSGTFTITFRGQTTAPIAFDATGDEIAAAMELLSTIGAGNVRSYPDQDNVYGLAKIGDENGVWPQFCGELGCQPVEPFTINDSTDGNLQVIEDYAGEVPVPAASVGRLLVCREEPNNWARLYVMTLDGWQAPDAELRSSDVSGLYGQIYFQNVVNEIGPKLLSWIRALGIDANSSLRLQPDANAAVLMWESKINNHSSSAYMSDTAAGLLRRDLADDENVMFVDDTGPGVRHKSAGNIQYFLSGTADPSADSGVAAPIGSRYSRETDGSEWKKTGAGDTDWQQLAFVS